ncbi:ATP-grasp fold amidoligase family protein [Novipirellula sp. SH528]|uniref:ATP-grasp fold amidoligase family protein n=1 Tax=Novipirellula sp. SH528 TaxID=3454466 RepID=UPI003FA0D0E9
MTTEDKIPCESVPEYCLINSIYRQKFGRDFPLEKPVTFFEKLNWLKIFDRRPLLVSIADKLAVRDIVRERVGARYLINCTNVFESAEAISCSLLPNAGVLKATHGWKMNFQWLNKESVDWLSVKRLSASWLQQKHGAQRGEWMYSRIQPRLIVEELVGNAGEPLRDYKFYCFAGTPKFLHVDMDLANGSQERVYYDTKWEKMDMTWARLPAPEVDPHMPTNFDEMLRVATRLSEGFHFLRVDLFNVNGRIYVGELTVFPSGGWAHLDPERWHMILGSWLHLPSLQGTGGLVLAESREVKTLVQQGSLGHRH